MKRNRQDTGPHSWAGSGGDTEQTAGKGRADKGPSPGREGGTSMEREAEERGEGREKS